MRLQILLLPLVELDGERHEQPFAFVVDQYDGQPSEEDMAVWDRFREKCGARAGMLTPDTVEIRQEHYAGSDVTIVPNSFSSADVDIAAAADPLGLRHNRRP